MKEKLLNIAIVGNAPKERHDLLNTTLSKEGLNEICNITLYGADGQPELEALLDAIEDCRDGKIQGIVCLPLSVTPLQAIQQCMTEKAEKAITLYVNNYMKMGNMAEEKGTGNITSEATTEQVIAKVNQITNSLKRDFLILNPRIAIAASGTTEWDAVIKESITELTKTSSIQAFGPIDIETFFDTNDGQAYDVIIQVHPEQCTDRFVTASDSDTVTVITGIDIPVTAAQYEGILQAVYINMDINRNRKEYDIPFASPLPKLYHERKEDGDKTRFTVKKKGFNPAEHRRENINYTTTRAPKTTEQNPDQTT
ncbi:MAG: 4-hydroxythreonine-4-phosphate dehydrogenase PdxA [Prevotellaceae bacterium]|nr:4-hydroxythreonine-4-phosphate dehydrogenase PdxA [Prevotellaceae bacterium]MDO4931661.1 4-hydroxythreonine-4-phosphate dehydrogenase PdxA [Prevotellaceae bacterium]